MVDIRSSKNFLIHELERKNKIILEKDAEIIRLKEELKQVKLSNRMANKPVQKISEGKDI